MPAGRPAFSATVAERLANVAVSAVLISCCSRRSWTCTARDGGADIAKRRVYTQFASVLTTFLSHFCVLDLSFFFLRIRLCVRF